MVVKSKYKHLYSKFADGGAVVADDAPKGRAAELTQEIADNDPAALRQNIDHLEADIAAGEDEINRSQNERSLLAYMEPTSLRAEREVTLQKLQEIGLNDETAAFFRENPELIDNYEQTYQAGVEAKRLGLEPYTPAFNRRVKALVDAKLNPPTDPIGKTLARARGTIRDDDVEHAIEGHNSTLVVAPRYSAPPSRRVPSGSYEMDAHATALTPEQLDACRISGSSPADYARGLIEMRRRRAAGDLQ